MNLEEYLLHNGYVSSGEDDNEENKEGASSTGERNNPFALTNFQFKSNYRFTKELAKQV